MNTTLYVTGKDSFSIQDPLPSDRDVHSITPDEIFQLHKLYKTHAETKEGFLAIMENGRGVKANVIGFTIALIHIKGPIHLKINAAYLTFYLSDILIISYSNNTKAPLTQYAGRVIAINADGSKEIQPW